MQYSSTVPITKLITCLKLLWDESNDCDPLTNTLEK